MLYLDSSVLIKRYFKEKGSRALNARFERGGEIYTSKLSFAEVHGAIARAFRMKEVTFSEFASLREAFEGDWLAGLSPLDVSLPIMISLPKLVEAYPLKASDAIHLSTAHWLRDMVRLRSSGSFLEESLEFGVADQRLGLIARKCGLQVFNPEEED
ncbi:MAG TPA: type II toxin-antitoxin system VapC family toxin [Candidatus Acidoferrales bacterium]|nr:type II toxin-antitoxin system VapC family toxin [Candidatus Acidoferrales bacterium]